MEEKTIADWEMENRPPIADSSRFDDQSNRIFVNLTEIEYEPVGRVDNRQSREPTKE